MASEVSETQVTRSLKGHSQDHVIPFFMQLPIGSFWPSILKSDRKKKKETENPATAADTLRACYRL